MENMELEMTGMSKKRNKVDKKGQIVLWRIFNSRLKMFFDLVHQENLFKILVRHCEIVFSSIGKMDWSKVTMRSTLFRRCRGGL